MMWLIPLAVVCFALALWAAHGATALSLKDDKETLEDVNHPAREFMIRQLTAGAWVAFACAVGSVGVYATGDLFRAPVEVPDPAPAPAPATNLSAPLDGAPVAPVEVSP